MATQEHTQRNGDYISVSIEDDDEALAKSMEAKLYDDSPLSAKCSIFRIPEVFRRHNEKAYEPDAIAIGPFHHKKPSLQPMQKVKQWIVERDRRTWSLTELVLRFFESSVSPTNHPKSTPGSRVETLHIVDLIRSVLISPFRDDPIPERPKFIPPVSLKPQLIPPVSLKPEKPEEPEKPKEPERPKPPENPGRPRLIEEPPMMPKKPHEMPERPHIVPERSQLIPCVTHLMEAGVKFTKSSSNNMVDIEFEDGTFKIPLLLIHETTESIFRNLIAFEQCYHSCKDKITSYAILLDNLINTSKDVEILSDKGVIDNWLSAEDASQYFNRLNNDTLVTNFFYRELCKEVNDYYRTKWHRWRAILMRDYFTTPWTIISLVAALILLVLTFLQTLYSIK
nr:uncharacterized protein LOC125424330 [Ziziphus jujuba var. spinosa]XP_048337410.1 uncharacterized protein LOC125424330 [Ziziphus jujuba var. spinosa]